jgi:hypothetical protein
MWGLQQAKKCFCGNSRWLSRDSIPVPAEYKSEALPLCQRVSCTQKEYFVWLTSALHRLRTPHLKLRKTLGWNIGEKGEEGYKEWGKAKWTSRIVIYVPLNWTWKQGGGTARGTAANGRLFIANQEMLPAQTALQLISKHNVLYYFNYVKEDILIGR